MKYKFKLFCFGFGQVAKYFVKNLIKKNINFELVTTNSKKTSLVKLDGLQYKSYFFFNNQYDQSLLKDLNSSNKVLISIPPKGMKDIVLTNFKENFKKNHFDWVTYLSATSVYGDKKGNWVNEETPPEPKSDNGVARINAENNWLKYFNDFNLPVQIFRLTGIYSNENNIIKRLKMGKLQLVEKKNHFFSRIHVEDIAEILTLSLKKIGAGQVFNISDNYPCSNIEIAKYAASLIKINLPKKISQDEIKNQILRNFYEVSKKVSNKKMKSFFNCTLKYPTFKEGLKNIKNHII